MSVPERYIWPLQTISGPILPAIIIPPTAWTAAQVTVAAVAVLIAAANPARRGLVVKNTTATVLALGPTNAVTVLNGFLLNQNESLTFFNTAGVWGITAGATVAATAEET